MIHWPPAFKESLDPQFSFYTITYTTSEASTIQLHQEIMVSSLTSTHHLIGHISHILIFWQGWIDIPILPSEKYYSRDFLPAPLSMRIQTSWITLSSLHIFRQAIATRFPPANISQPDPPLYPGFIVMTLPLHSRHSAHIIIHLVPAVPSNKWYVRIL